MNKSILLQQERYSCRDGKSYQKNKEDAISLSLDKLADKLYHGHAAKILQRIFPGAKTVLCVGVRTDLELLTFERFGYDAVGIDVAKTNFALAWE